VAARTQGRIDAGRQSLVGVNRYRPIAEEPLHTMKIDNAAVRTQQIERLKALRAERDEAETQARLAALEAGARGKGNLLALSIDAARAKATVGEISLALEKVFGRHQAEVQLKTGVYAEETRGDARFARAKAMVEAFAQADGRAPSVLIAKLGQDGHDRGQKVVASGFSDLGFDVDVGVLFQTPAEAVADAVKDEVHVLGVSSLAAGHLALVPEVQAELKRLGREDIMVVVGGVIPDEDVQSLVDMGVAAVFQPGERIADAAIQVLEALNQRLGYSQ
jgi:methylmalonyl-CoA mutase